MKRVMYVSIAMLCISISALIGFHMGAGDAEAQGGTVVGFASDASDGLATHYVILSNGDVYRQRAFNQGALGSSACDQAYSYPQYCGAPDYIGNFWGGQPVPTSPSTMGGVKSKFR